MFVSAIIVAAGSGKRMGADIPKQFIPINDKTIFEHTLDSFVLFDLFDEIIVVLAEDYISFVDPILKQYPSKTIKTCKGGAERFHSVQNALNEVNTASNMVFIHDAVRPFCSLDLVKECYTACNVNSSAIPAVSLKDSIREIDEKGTSKIIDRSNLRSIQTPQVFNYKELYAAYQVPFSASFTDDASVYEKAGHPIHLIEGETFNIKITTPDDLEFARRWL